MGHEIVYCFKCSKRLLSADFEHGGAVRTDNKVVCEECAPSISGGAAAQAEKAESRFT